MSAANAAVAVFDLGKTNSKMLAFSADGKLLCEARTQPQWPLVGDLRCLDDSALAAWMLRVLGEAVEAHGVDRVIVSAHGCTFALLGEDALVHPVVDYEQEPPPEIAARIDREIPPFSETFSPRLPLGLNLGRHLLWLAERDPGLFGRVRTILCYPQFWTWRLCGARASEVSYLGCHSHLWSPARDDYSTLVDGRGWREKLPPLRRAGEVVGQMQVALPSGGSRSLDVHNGVHDSNASLAFYRAVGFDAFTLVSTGTWVIVFNGDCPLEALDGARDMLANVTVDHRPVATARFMGGREFDVISGGWRQPITAEMVRRVIKRGILFLPSFASGGPAQETAGECIGPEPDAEERAAAALLYIVAMTDLTLDLVRSRNRIIVDGGLVRSDLFAPLLADLRPGQDVLRSHSAEGTASGAAALAFATLGLAPFPDECFAVEPSGISGVREYVQRWRDLTEARRSRVLEAGRATVREATA